MLDTLRSAAGTWVAKLLLLLLVLSFAVWGISGSMLGGVGGNTVVTAGDTEVSVADYRLAYDRQVSVLSQQFGQRITREQATALGIDNQVLAQLVAGAVLDEQARLMRLGVSRDKLALLTADDPAFRGSNGRFDRQQFEFVLRQVGMRPEDYIRNREQVAVRQQIVEAVSDGLDVPETFLRAVALYQGEDRTIEYIAVPASSVQPIEEPADTALSTFFEENKADYAAPEYRAISYIKLDPEALADPSSVGDDEVRADYERDLARYTTPETRRIEQLVFADESAAQAAVAQIRSGSSFESVVAAQGRAMGDVLLGTYAKTAVPDQAVAEAAFALEAGAVSDVVAGSFGPVLLRVTDVQPAVVKPLEEASTEIRQALAMAEASRILLDTHDSYEDARAGGETMEEAARRLKLDVVKVPAVSRAGQDPEGKVLSDLPQSAELLREAFESEPGIENQAIPIGNDGFVFYEVDSTTPARDTTLDEVRERVVADWKAAEATKRLSAKTAELEKRIDGGEGLDTIAAELSLEKQTKRGLRRDGDDPDLGAAGAAAVFAVAPNQGGVTPAPAGDAQIVFKVTEVFEPAGAGADAVPEDAQRNFATGMADDLLDQLVARLQSEQAVTVNRGAITRALSF